MGDNHRRFQISLEAGTDGLDDATEAEPGGARRAGKRLVAKSAKEIDEACERLV